MSVSNIPTPAMPILFSPVLKPKVWGGRRLEGLGKALPAGIDVGESWELADLPPEIDGGVSTIYGGPLDGVGLATLRQAHPNELLGSMAASHGDRFPLLLKYLDACDNLSVQVHPSPDYAAAHDDAHLKSEAWVVIEAAPDAVIYKGLKPGVTAEAFAAAISSGAVVDDLIAVPAVVGDCHYLPSGTCHALGAGVLVAEVQTPSDTTFRVYDWGRTDRALHIGPSLECIDFSGAPVVTEGAQRPVVSGPVTTTRLMACEHFVIERIDVKEGTQLEFRPSNRPMMLMVLAGRGNVATPAGSVDIDAGATVLLAAMIEQACAEVSAGTTLLQISPPGPAPTTLA